MHTSLHVFPSLKWKDKENIKFNSFQKWKKSTLFLQIMRDVVTECPCLCLLPLPSTNVAHPLQKNPCCWNNFFFLKRPFSVRPSALFFYSQHFWMWRSFLQPPFIAFLHLSTGQKETENTPSCNKPDGELKTQTHWSFKAPRYSHSLSFSNDWMQINHKQWSSLTAGGDKANC